MKSAILSTLAVMSIVAIGGLCNGCGKGDSGKETATTESATETKKTATLQSQEVSAEQDKYEQVNPSELSFEIKDFNYRGVVVAGGGVKPSGGHIGAFLCEGQPLELSSNEFKDGFVRTKNYGKIKVIFGTSLYGEPFAVFLTPTQKKSLLAMKAK